MTTDPLFGPAIDFVLRHEGGLVDNPNDAGELTNFGLSLKSYPQLGADGIRNLTVDQARAIYWTDWWLPHLFGQFPAPIGAKVFDCAVNTGAVTAIRLFQTACNQLGANLTLDGHVGPRTLDAARVLNGPKLRDLYTSALVAHYQALVDANPSNAEFLDGWIARANDWSIGP